MSPRLLPGEAVLWQGRPSWRAVARDVLRVHWIAAYLMLMLIWDFASDRSSGLSVGNTLFAAIPLLVLDLLVLAGAAGFAIGCARTTKYLLTPDRLIMTYGVALPATLSVPLRRVRAVAMQARADGTADIALALKPGARVTLARTWPHVRFRRHGRSEPMLRGVPGGAAVAALLSQTVASVTPGVLHAGPARPAEAAPAGAILSPAGD